MCTINISIKTCIKIEKWASKSQKSGGENPQRRLCDGRAQPSGCSGGFAVGGGSREQHRSPPLTADGGRESHWGARDPCPPSLGSSERLCSVTRLCPAPSPPAGNRAQDLGRRTLSSWSPLAEVLSGLCSWGFERQVPQPSQLPQPSHLHQALISWGTRVAGLIPQALLVHSQAPAQSLGSSHEPGP